MRLHKKVAKYRAMQGDIAFRIKHSSVASNVTPVEIYLILRFRT